jgi:hypothetical protein
MNKSHNLIMTGIVAGQFLKSILKYGERASLNEVHARQYNPAFHKRPYWQNFRVHSYAPIYRSGPLRVCPYRLTG